MGGSNVAASAIAVDSAGAAYITGSAASNDLPLVNPFQTTPAGVFAQKLNPEGSGLAYSTYLGGYLGGSGDSGQGIAVDTLGSAYVVGQTAASNFPLKNPLQSSYVGLAFGPNAFMTKFSPDGSFLIYSTYLGGSSPFLSSTGDVATGVAVDHFGNAHVTGSSSSCDFPLTLDAFSTDCTTSGDQKIFALTLNSTGNQMLFSTFLRSGSGGSPPQIAVDQNGNSYVAGTTTATDLPVINAIETRSNGGFITELDLSGKLLFSTYLGGVIGGSVPVGIGLDGKGGIYVAGFGQGDFPLLHPLASQVKPVPGNVLQIFAAKIVSKNAPQFSLSPRVSPFLTLQNVSSVPLTINSIVPSTNFTMGGDCGSSLAPGTGCDLILEGAADNKSSGTVTISTNAYAVPQKFVIWKAPKGDSVGPLITISPTGVQFPAQLIGTTSAAQQVVIKNMGLQQAAINSISMILPSAFTETNNCPALLNPADSCTVSITYKAATVQDSAQIAVLHDPNQTRDTISLGGDGSASAIAVSTSSVGFGSQSTGAAPLGRIVNLTNTTPYPAAVTSVSASANFAQTNTCSAPLAPQASCRAAVTFVPSGNQDATGTLTAANFGPGGPQTVNLSGTGRSAGDLGVDPPQLSFVSSVGFESILGTINLTNNSQKMISISSIQVFSPFLETNTCPGSLAPGGSCQISVGFKPKQVGPFSGALKVTFAGNGSPQVVGLTGQANTEVHFDPSPVLFGEQRLNVAAPGGVNIVNLGAKTFSLGSVTVQGSEFALAKNNCGPTLMQDRVCGLELAFTPAGTGIRTGTITLMAGDAPIPHVAMLQGIGISNGQGTLSAASLEFGSQTIGTQSNPQTVKLKNNGSGALQLGGIVTSPQFTQTNTCGSFLAAKAQCTISIRFAPTLPGMLVGSLSVQDDGAGSPHTLALNGISQ
jgi:hypothetical protein